MKFKVYYFLLLMIGGNVFTAYPSEDKNFLDHNRAKLHEEWWQFTLGNTVTYDLFADWLGDYRALSRQRVYQHVKEKGYSSLLDVPCGLCIDFKGLKQAHVPVDYYGVDITQKLVDRAQKRKLKVWQGSIENLPCEAAQFDMSYARHILEHLDYYEKAISELIRVARKEVLIVFFMKPSEKPDFIDLGYLDGHAVYHNLYNKEKLEKYVLNHTKVTHIEWEEVSDNENILHVYLA